ncbi:MAG: hypothetical protein GTO13_19335, partial [Proteobacteria bacterium]|nr:hypothetical protein [Pseudomonadota bacterium]
MFRRIRFLIPILLFMMSSIAYGAAGDLDTFGTSNGFVTYDSGRDDFGRVVVVQVGGEIVAAPDSYNGAGQSKPLGLVATEDEVRQFFANYVERCARKEIDGFLSL